MRWPFRRSSAVDARTDDARTEDTEEPELEPTPSQTPAPGQESSTAAWQDLPSMTPSLRAMPTMTDASFSRSLPTRWNTPPALGALGHDVRTDVPGGLVSGVARTVDPRDTRPADLIWRTPDVSAFASPKTLAPPQRVPTTLSTSTAQSVQPNGTVQSVQPDETSQPVQPGETTQPVQPDGTPQSVQPARTVRPAQPTDNSSASVSPSAGASPIAASPGTAQTRQVLQNAASAVEARDPRPVPADVTDGPTANAPVQGVNAEPGPEMLASPPSTPTSEPGILLTPREARPGPDPLGSAPAAVPPTATPPAIAAPAAAPAAAAPLTAAPLATAPLVSRTPLPRSIPQPTTRQRQTPQVAPVTSTEPASIPESESESKPASISKSGFGVTDTPQPPTITPEFTSSEPDLAAAEPESADAEPPTPQFHATDHSHATEPQPPLYPANQPSPASEPLSTTATTSATPAASNQPTAPAAAATTATSHVAPLVSAMRFVPTAAPINVLQAPTAPVDQPMRAAESILGAELFASTFASPAAAAGPARRIPQPTAQRAPTQTLLNHAIADLNNVSSGVTHHARQAQETPQTQTVTRQPQATAPQTASPANTPVSQASVHAPAAHDPAALDSLARQLYGRFSRHLAGELLIDRERSQFLTDLS